MTIETQQASRPSYPATTMFAQSPTVFPDISSPVTSDHSLHTDLRFPSSPNSLTMYDGDTDLLPGSLGSMCSDASFVDTGQPEDFDLKPQFECSNNAFLNQCLEAAGGGDDPVRSDPAWSPTEAGLMKMEDIFQVDQKDAIQGPTLAELNFDDSLSVYDDVIGGSVQKKSDGQKKFVSGGYALWQQAVQSGMDPTLNVAQVVNGGQKPPVKFTTCTVTSSNTITVDSSAGSDKSFSPRSLPNMFSVMAKMSLFSDVPTVKSEAPDPVATSSPCLTVASSAPGTFGMHSGLPMTVATKATPERGIQSVLPSSMEIDSNKSSSLQRLLTDPLPVTIKTEPVEIPLPVSGSSLWRSSPATSPCSSLSSQKSIKRALSPDVESNMSTTSMEQKWEEIKQFIHNEQQSPDGADGEQRPVVAKGPHAATQPVAIAPKKMEQPEEGPLLSVTPPKRIKTEPCDPAFTVKDEVESADEDADSDVDDSDAGSDTLQGKDDISDDESESTFGILDDNVVSSKGPPRYFWMYNTQSKGPKGKRLCKAVSTVDPYTLNDFEDPVFDPELNQTQYKHNGKARRGDGNDITPSPQKLYALGNELKKLNRIINDLTPVSELPAGARSKSRKEKNKLASRACRLKKKAQHEANKVKLYGLEREHQNLLTVLEEIRNSVFKQVNASTVAGKDEALSPKLERLMKIHLTHMIAGHTADYVNSVLARVVNGDPMGGLAL